MLNDCLSRGPWAAILISVFFLVSAGQAADQELPAGVIGGSPIIGPVNTVSSATSGSAIASAANVTIKAGKVILKPGFSVAIGGALHVQLVPFVPSPIVTPIPIADTTATLAVSGVQYVGGTGSLTYDWNVISGPAGTVSFSPNQSTAASTTTATFSGWGSYIFQVTVTAPDGATNSNVISVVRQAPPTVTVTALDANAAEAGSDPGSFRFTRDVAPAMPLTVRFTVGGTAVSGSDFTSLGTAVTIPSGESSVTLALSPLDDVLAEVQETVVVTIDADVAYQVGMPSSASVAITDNETSPTIVAGPSVAPDTVQGTRTTTVHALGADDGGEANLTYTWATSGTQPGTVIFAANGTNAAKDTELTVSALGYYAVTVTITDLDGQSVTSGEIGFYVVSRPAIDPVPAQSVVAGGILGPVTLHVTDTEFPPEAVSLMAWSDEANLIVDGSVLITGDGAYRQLTARAVPGSAGTAQIRIEASDQLWTEFYSFPVTVGPFVGLSFSPAPGTYFAPLTVAIAATPPGGDIWYTTSLGGTPADPDPGQGVGAVYSTPILLSPGATTIKAVHAIGSAVDPAVSSSYVILDAADYPDLPPAISPAPGIYPSPLTVTMSASAAGDQIHYTLDGTTPTAASPVYSGALTVTADATVKAVTIAPGLPISAAASAIFVVAPRTSDIPSPVVAYAVGRPSDIELIGWVPEGFGIDGLLVEPVAPTGLTDSHGEIINGVFHVVIRNIAPPVAAMTVNLSFIASAAPARISEVAPVSVAFGDGMGGTTITGSPAGLPPFIGEVTMTILAGLTGVQRDTVAEKLYHYTKKNETVTVQVEATVSPGVITGATLILSDGRTFDATDGTAEIPMPSEGIIEFSARVVAEHDGLRTSRENDEAKPIRLIVDSTPPKLIFTIRKDYWPERYNRNAVPEPVVPQPHGTEGWDKLILLNGNDAATNELLRRTRGMNAYDKAGYTLEAVVDDMAGLNPHIDQEILLVTPDSWETPAPPGFDLDALQTTIRPPHNPKDPSEPQRVSINGFAELPDSVQYSRDGTGVRTDWFIGRYLCRFRYEDRAGNRADETPLGVMIKAAEPLARTTDASRNSPARFTSAPLNDTAEAWQGTIDPSTRLLSHASRSDTGTLWSNWRLNNAVALPQGSPPPVVDLGTLMSWGGWYPYGTTFQNVANSTMLVQDAYGNRSDDLDVSFDVGFLIAEHGINWFVRYDYGFCADLPTQADTAYVVTVSEGNITPVTFGTQAGAWELAVELDAESGVAIDAHPLPGQTFTRYGGERGNLIIDISNLDPGAGPQRRLSPAVFTIPPSWNPTTTVTVRATDVVIAERVGNPSLPQDHSVALRSQDGGDWATAAAAPVGSSAIEATLNLRRTKAPPSGSGAQIEAMRPGMAEFGYSFGEGYLYTYDVDQYYAAGHQGGNARWATLVRATPDVVATGSRMTIRIEGGFIDREFSADTFGEWGDYVRFLQGETDITMGRDEYGDGTTADAERRKTRIAIAGQRLISTGPEATIRQALELDLVIGPEVQIGLCHIDVNLGTVKAYEDPHSLPNKGLAMANGDGHRMKEALRVITLEWVRPADRAAAAEPFSTSVLHASAAAPTVTVEGTPSVEIYDETARLSFGGTIADPIVDQEPGGGDGPLTAMDLFVDGQAAGTASVTVSSGTTGLWKPNARIGRFTASATLSMNEGVQVVTARTHANVVGTVGEARLAIDLQQIVVPGIAAVAVGGGGTGISLVQVVANLERIDADHLRLWFGAVPVPGDALILARVSDDRFCAQVETATVEAQVVLPVVDATTVGRADLTLRYILSGGAMTALKTTLIETSADSEHYQGTSIIPGTTTGPGGGAGSQPVKTWVGRVVSVAGTAAGGWVPMALRFKGIDDQDATLAIKGTEYQTIERDGWKYAANGDKPAIFGVLSGTSGGAAVRMPQPGGASVVTVPAGQVLPAQVRAWGEDGPVAEAARQGLEEIDVGDAGSPRLVSYAHVGVVGAAIALDHGATRVDLATGIVTVKGKVLDPLDAVSGRDDVLVLVNGAPATLEAAPTTPASDLSAARPRSFTAQVLLTRNLELVQATAMNAVGAVTNDIMAISAGQIGADNPGSPRWSRAVRYHFGPYLRHTALSRSTWKVFIAAGPGDDPPRRRVKVKPDARGAAVSDALVVSRVGKYPFADAVAAVSSDENGKLLPVTSLDDDLWVIVEAPGDERKDWIPDLTAWETTDQGWRRRIQQAGAEIVSDDVPGGKVIDRETPGTVTLPLRTRNLRGGPLPMLLEQVGIRKVHEHPGPAMTAPPPASRKAGAEPVAATTASATAPLAIGANRVVVFPSDADGAVAPVSSIDVYAADRDFPYTSGNAVGWAAGAKPDASREFGRPVLPPQVDTVPRGHIMLIELVAGVDVGDERLTRFLRDHDLEIVASTRWDGDSRDPGVHTTLWVRVGGDVGMAEADWAQQHGTLIRGVGGNLDERALMTAKAKAVWAHLQDRRRGRKGEMKVWSQQYDVLTKQLDRELAEGRHQLVQQGTAAGTRSFDVFDLRYSDGGMDAVYNSNVFNLSNTRMPFTDAMGQNALRNRAGRNGPGVLRRFTYTGHDRTARRSTSANTGEMLLDQSPRVFFQQQPVDTTGFTQGLQNADGLVVVVHGFNVGQGRDGDEGGATLRVDLADDGDPYRLLASYWPVLETTLRTRTISGAPVISDQTCVLHVWWSGTFAGFMDSGAYFNIDMATAHITGREKLGPFLLAVAQGLAQVPGKRLPITLLAESLGNRVATSAARFLQESDDARLFDEGNAAPLRFVMIHPALRQIDLTPDFAGDKVEEQPRMSEDRFHPYPQSPLLGELGVLSSASAGQARTLALFSPFDKAGLSFLAAQRDDPTSPAADIDLSTPMLGRVGPLGAEALPADRARYEPAAGRANLRGHQVGGDDVFSTDFWHVDLFGWSLPDVPFRSRHLFERNVSNANTETRVAGTTDVRAGLFARSVTRTPSWHQITIRPSAVQAAWTLPRQLIQQGHVPER